ncbi:MAG: hypothetical protein AAFR67_04260 [Chloroflexota bacterium]
MTKDEAKAKVLECWENPDNVEILDILVDPRTDNTWWVMLILDDSHEHGWASFKVNKETGEVIQNYYL